MRRDSPAEREALGERAGRGGAPLDAIEHPLAAGALEKVKVVAIADEECHVSLRGVVDSRRRARRLHERQALAGHERGAERRDARLRELDAELRAVEVLATTFYLSQDTLEAMWCVRGVPLACWSSSFVSH